MSKKFLFILTGVLLTVASAADAAYVVGDKMPVSSAADGKKIVIEAASTTVNYGYFIKETAANEARWQLGFSQNSVWVLEATGTTVSKNGTYNVSADGYYIKNAVTGRYIASCPRPYGTPTTVENRADATVFGIFSSTNTPYDWTDYSNQTAYPRGWDDDSWVFFDTSDYFWRNDISGRSSGDLGYSYGTHTFMWNVYSADETTLPVADVLDVKFAADGTAADVSPMSNAVAKNGTVPTYYSEKYGGYVAQFNNAYGGSTSSFYKIDYAAANTDGQMLAALQDGHTLETVFSTRIPVEDKEAKWFSSHQQGGTGLLICKKNGNSAGCDNEITFLPNVGGYKWATSGVVPEVDEFYHVVGVWDKAAGKARIYVNGELKNEVAASGNLTLSGNNIYHWFAIGADPSAANGANTSGTWDVVSCKIYDDALTTEQVGLIYADLINRTGRNSLIEYVNKVKDSVDTDTYASQFNAVDDYKTILEQCQAAIAANTATGAEYNALEQQLRAAYAQVQMPVADVLDVKFHDDGRATDESTMGNTIHQKGDITVEDASNKDGNVYYNKELGRYVYQTDNTWGAATPPAGYYVIDYAPSRTSNNPKAPQFYSAFSDGFAVECYMSSRIEAPNNNEAKFMGGTAQGGWAMGIKNKKIALILNTGTSSSWKFAYSNSNIEKDRMYHIVAVWDKANTTARLYVDGVYQSEVTTNPDYFVKASSIDGYYWNAIGCGTINTGSNGPNLVKIQGGGSWDIAISRIYDAPLSDFQAKLLFDQLSETKSTVLHDYVYPDGHNFVEGSYFPIYSKDFEEGDVITLTPNGSTTPAASGTATIIAKGGKIKLPAIFDSGTYTVKVSRGELTQELGTTTLTKATKMPKPARAVAHRGWYTKGGGTSQNSRQAVRNAFGAGFYGCEIDVHQTTDGYIMVNHDFSIGGVTINLSTYDQVKDKTLSNGEKIPQLSDLFAVMKDEYPDSPTKLVIELKVNANTDTLRLANSVVQAVKDAGLQDRVEYISFGLSACKYVRQADPTAFVQLLDTQAPTVVKNNDLQCLDYGYTNFLNNPTWIDQAEQMGLYLNAWTIDDKAYMVRFNNLGVDYITSNYPEIVQQLYELFKDMMPDSDISYSEQDNEGVFSGSTVLTPEQYTAYVQANKPAYIDLSNVSVSKELTLKQLKEGMGENTLYDLPANSPLRGDNIIKGGQCESLVLTDKQPLNVATAFTAAKVTYERASTGYQWGTVCLPYSLTASESIKYYQLSSVSGTTMLLTEVGTVQAGQPAIYCMSDASAFTANRNEPTTIEAGTTDVASGDYTLVGVMDESVTLSIGSDNYYIANDKFWAPTTNAVTVVPFRAYFKAAGSGAPSFDIAIDDDPTSIVSHESRVMSQEFGTVYDLSGRRINGQSSMVNGQLPKGIYIHNGKKIIVK